MGSPDFAVPSLRATAEVCDLRVVVSQPDRPAGRGRKLLAPAVKQEAEQMGVPVLQPRKVRDGALREALAAHELDVIVVVAYGRILPVDILELPRLGCINVHGSLLPRWRGAAPIQRAVLAGDAESGVSIMQMDEGCDTGPVFRMVETPVGPFETSGELFERLSTLGGEALAEFLRALPDHAPPVPQEHDRHTHAPKLEKAEGRVDWGRGAAELINHVRGMDPWPAATTTRAGQVMKLYTARPSYEGIASSAPGTVLAVDEQGLHVSCGPQGEQAIRVLELQPAGKKRMEARAYATGKPFEPGERLGEEDGP